MRARSNKSFTLCLYMKTIRTKQAKVQFAYFVQRDRHGVITKDLTQSSILMWRFRCSCRRSFLISLFLIFVHPFASILVPSTTCFAVGSTTYSKHLTTISPTDLLFFFRNLQPAHTNLSNDSHKNDSKSYCSAAMAISPHRISLISRRKLELSWNVT